MDGLTNWTPLFVTGYPAAWRIENVDIQQWTTDAVYRTLLGTHEEDLGSTGGSQRQRHKGEMLFIDTSGQCK